MRSRLEAPAPALRLHGSGEFRRRLAVAFGRPEAEGDVVWRRLVHGSGAFVLVYFVVPNDFFVVVPKEVVLLLALALACALEALRLRARLELPAIRGYELDRPASFVFYAVALVLAVLVFPEGIAAAVVLGTAFVDPLAGELRSDRRFARWTVAAPLAAYLLLATTALDLVGRWPLAWAVGLGLAAAVAAVGVERWRFRWLDDDLTMTVVPAVLLYAAALGLGLPR